MTLEDIAQNSWVLAIGGVAAIATAGTVAYFIFDKIAEYMIVKKEIEKEKGENYTARRNLIVKEIQRENPNATPEYIKEQVILRIGPSKIEAEEERRRRREERKAVMNEERLKNPFQNLKTIDGKIIGRSYTAAGGNNGKRRLSLTVRDKKGEEHDVYINFSEEDLDSNDLVESDILEIGSTIRYKIDARSQEIDLEDVKIFEQE